LLGGRKTAIFLADSCRHCSFGAGFHHSALRAKQAATERVPVPFKFFSNLSRTKRVVLFASALLVAPGATFAREPAVSAKPVETGDTLTGNYLAAILAGAQSDTAAASAYFREVLRRDPRNTEVAGRAFVAALSNGDMEDSFRIADQIIKRESSNGLARLALAVKAIKTGQYATARTHLSRGKMAQANDVTGTLLNAWTWLGSGDRNKALETIASLNNPALTLFRDFHGALINDVSGRRDEALTRMQAAYDSDKNTLRLVETYASMIGRKGDREKALSAYKAFDALLPRHPIVVAAMNNINDGKPIPPTVADSMQGAAEVLYGLGSANPRRGQELVPMIYLRLAIYLRPDHPLAIVSLADIYDRLKQYERAIEVYDLMPKTSPLRPNADLQIGLTLETLERKDEAQAHLESILTQRPNDPEALLALGNLHRTRKEYPKAVDYYSKVLEISPKNDRGNWSTYYYRAVTFERMKQWPAAEADFKKALELFPDQPSVLNYLGYSWVDRGENLEEAFRMLRKAVELRPTDGYIVDSLGWAYYRLGRYEEALRELERAIELRPADPTINDHLGDVYWKVGRKLEAGFQWNHARDLKPEEEDLPRILKKIELGLDEVERLENEKKNAGSQPAPASPAAPVDAPEPPKNGG
jgi:tetratricopeptide (TPR) repeat protein